MRNKFLILSFVLAGSAALAVNAVNAESDAAAVRINVGRQEVETNAMKLVSEGNDLLSDGKYFEARDCYIKAKQELQKYNAPLFEEKIAFCDKQIAVCYYEKAEEAIDKAESLSLQRDFEEAIKLCREAIKYCPEQAAKLEDKIATLSEHRDAAAAKDAVSSKTLLPNKENQEYKIEVLMEQGRRLVAAKQYTKALKKFREVLLITPYHADAVQCIQMLNNRLGELGLKRYVGSRRKLIAEAEWKYAIPLRPDANANAGTNMLEGTPKAKVEQEGDSLVRKMQEIVIPSFKFDDADVATVIKGLSDLSRRYDADKQGVNFVLRRPVKAAVADNVSGESSVVDESVSKDSKTATGDVFADTYVSMDQRNQNLLSLVKQLCQQANLSYRVEKFAVVVAPKGLALDDLETKLFAVNIPEGQDQNIETVFKASGVTFPQGSRLFYDNKINRLVAINTPDNLQKIEECLKVFDDDTPMIQVMVKFIEISQNDLDELAFNWQYSVNSNKPLSVNGEAKHTMVTKESNQLLRYYRPEAANEVVSNPTNDATLQYIWQNQDGTKISAQMFALNWADSSDVLYSPRITTLDGETARIGMYTERYFPQDWETADVESSEDQLIRLYAVDPQPELDNLQKLGLSFEITPQIIDKDNGLIKIPIEFPIRTFIGYKVYDARSYDLDGNVDGEYYQMPIFNDRSVQTEVILRDGETVILAGIATDISTIVHDKIPILGDLPLIGRLFQSRYTDSQKGNLLIFLTCRLVKSDGSAYNPGAGSSRGIPSFGRIN